MLSLRTAPSLTRALLAAALGLLLALRLLSPAGFMPALDHGSVTIVACPDAGVETPAPMKMRHNHQQQHKEQCPYASASSLGALGIDFHALADVLIIGAALLLGRSFLFLKRHKARERPPLRAPPIPV